MIGNREGCGRERGGQGNASNWPVQRNICLAKFSNASKHIKKAFFEAFRIVLVLASFWLVRKKYSDTKTHTFTHAHKFFKFFLFRCRIN